MGLSDEDKVKHPYFMGKRREEEEKRFEKFKKSPEYIRIQETHNRAFEDYLYQLIMADFYARNLKATVEQVASATSFWIVRLNDLLFRTRFYLIEKMLERFDLVRKENLEKKRKRR